LIAEDGEKICIPGAEYDPHRQLCCMPAAGDSGEEDYDNEDYEDYEEEEGSEEL